MLAIAGQRMNRFRQGRGRLAALGLILMTTMSSSGCLWAPELSQIRAGLERQLPGAEFSKEMRVSLGPLSLGLARFLTRFIPEGQVPEAEELHQYLQEVRRVQVAIYETQSIPSLQSARMPEYLKNLMQRENWQLAVKKQEKDELVWVFTREEEGFIRDIYVVTLSPEELLLVRVEGRMERLLGKAMENHADELPQMLGLELN